MSDCCQGFDGPCHNKGKRRRQSTQYEDEEKNWVHMCDDCFGYNEAELAYVLWADYYGERIKGINNSHG